MGFIFTLVFVALAILSPDQLSVGFAAARPVLLCAGLAAITSVPALLRAPERLKSLESILLLAFLTAIALSELVHLWFGGVIEAYARFLPSAAAFYFLVINVNTPRRAAIAIQVLVICCLILVSEGFYSLATGWQSEQFAYVQNLFDGEQYVGSELRLMATGFLNDPNDFAQYLITTIPLLFIAWRKGKFVRNAVFVLLPGAYMGYAIFRTHSRGALIGLAVLVLMTLRERFGTVFSAIQSAIVFGGLLALGFTGGRGISAGEGADRLDAWATGLTLLRENPIFGVGFGRFTEHLQITAHNSFVLCFAELGLVGFTIWMCLIVKSWFELSIVSRLNTYEGTGDAQTNLNQAEDTASLARMAGLLRLSLISFLATAWFLSRTFIPTLYILFALASAVTYLAKPYAQGAVEEATNNLFRKTIGIEAAVVVALYAMVRAGQ